LVGSRTALSEEWGTSTGVCGWGRDHVYQLWRGWGAPLEPRICSYGRRADGLVEPDNPYVGLVIPITLVRVRHLLNGTTHAKTHLASRCGNIGHCVDVPGPASVDYGSRRRNIEELSGELTLTREGLRMALEVRVGDYLPETVRGDGTAEPGRRTFNLDYVVSWESLFLAGLGFDYHRRRE
jgi:hypothetical protein